MSNENKCENMDNQQGENPTNLPSTKNENSTTVCDANLEKNTGVAIKNIESEALDRLLAYDSDSSSSSEMMRLNLNWRAQDGSEESSSSSSSSSEDEEDSETGGDREDDPQPTQTTPQNRGAIKKSQPKVNDELGIEHLPPVPDLSTLQINVENESFVHMGNVFGIVDKLVTIAALPNTPAYDLDTLLFLDNGKRPLGFVFDVLGQVTSPIYAIRFNSVEDIKNLQIEIGTKVYSAPTSKHTQYVFLQQLLKMRGSDASWMDDTEVPPEFADYSDDENECYHRFGNKKLSPHLKRTHSSDNYKKFETTMNRKNILNTKFNKYMDSYKQARVHKAKSKRPQAPNIHTAVPIFDPSVPPPNLGHYHQPVAQYVGLENNNMGASLGYTPNFFMNNFVSNSPSYFANHPGPSHQ
ncbi:H/ACA ribonucleoprotein complex non-core subunit NAF1 [Tribolium madens]|uniref:H/ACA ribonucleoprotein complex non-core subunit NAF1 n=1 Tax=Tribolium madens TaxID=41895 RepID=UPI001CF7577F|nr:H/ACA ribonucleoprotein complex non-core subunit NAF1 [Tribolium madens]